MFNGEINNTVCWPFWSLQFIRADATSLLWARTLVQRVLWLGGLWSMLTVLKYYLFRILVWDVKVASTFPDTNLRPLNTLLGSHSVFIWNISSCRGKFTNTPNPPHFSIHFFFQRGCWFCILWKGSEEDKLTCQWKIMKVLACQVYGKQEFLLHSLFFTQTQQWT